MELKKLTPDELIECAFVDALPQDREVIEAELRRRMTPTGDVAELLDLLLDVYSSNTLGNIESITNRFRAAVAALQQKASMHDIVDEERIERLDMLFRLCSMLDIEHVEKIEETLHALQQKFDSCNENRSYWLQRIIKMGQLFGYNGDQCAVIACECIESGAEDIAALQSSESGLRELVRELVERTDLYLSDGYGMHTCTHCGKDYRRMCKDEELPSNYPKILPSPPNDFRCMNPKCPAVRARTKLEESK